MGKKIIVITSSFPKNEGDFSGWFVYEACRRLAEKGHKIIVLAPHCCHAELKEDMCRIEVHRFPYFYPYSLQKLAYGNGITYNLKMGLLPKIQVPLFLLSQMIYSIRLASNKNIGIVQSQWLMPQGLVGAGLRRFFRIPHIATIHSSEVTLMKRLPLGRRISKFIIDNTDIMVSVSSHRIDELLSFTYGENGNTPAKRIEIIPMGVNLSEFARKEPSYADTLKKGFCILFVGRFVEVKGCEYLIEAFKAVAGKTDDASLVMVGSGSLETKLRAMVKDLGIGERVRFEGYVEHSRIAGYYYSCDVVVFPSIVDSSGFEEGLPVVLLEALAAGKPIIATRTKGVMEAIQEGYNGLLVDPKSSKQIEGAISTLLNDESLRKSLSKNAAESAKKYDWNRIADRYHELIDEASQNG